jgi:hypothetical protein
VGVVRQHTGPWGRALRWASELEVLTPKTVGGEGLSWEHHYQVLPLFQHIPPEALPREGPQAEEGREDDTDARTDPRSRHRTRPISAWQEAARRARGGRERHYGPKVPVQRIFTDFRGVLREAAPVLARDAGPVTRAVVVGDPGAGKTTLMGYLVREHLAGRLGRPDGVPRVPVLVRLREWESRHPNRDLPALLARLVRARPVTKKGLGQAAASTAQWADWLARGRVVLLFDGLDEVGSTFAGKVQAVLNDAHWQQCPILITCRTVSFEQHQRLGKGLPVFELSPLERPQWAAFVRAYPAGKHTAHDPEALLERLRANPGL